MDLPNFSSPEVWVSLLTLTFLEIVLGIDNIIFIAIAADKLPPHQQKRARNLGLLLAMFSRILLLFGISILIAMQDPFWHIDLGFITAAFSGQSFILFLGGLFLLYKSTTEIHGKLEGEGHIKATKKNFSNFSSVIIQIVLIDVVFSFDSVLTAVGLADSLFIMVLAVVISILVMMTFANPVAGFVNKHPTVQMLALSFLILIGFMLMAEGAHLAHMQLAGAEIGSVPKGYLYFAIAFSVGVEFLNMRIRKRIKPVQMHSLPQEAENRGILNDDE